MRRRIRSISISTSPAITPPSPPKGDQLHYEREFVVHQVELPAARAADFRKLESAILMDEKGTAVLKKQ